MPKRKIYETAHKIFVVLSGLFDLRMYNINLLWFHDQEFTDAWQGFPEANNAIHERRFNLYNLAKSVYNIPGDLAECGVYKGAGSYLILKANENSNKQMHLFDSFEGLSEPQAEDAPENNRTFRWKKGDLRITKDQVQKNLSEFSNVQCYKGWIPERFNDVADSSFSFVHLDVDLYQPTYDALEFFYERVNSGGIIVCDDYGFESCPGAYKAVNDFMEDKPEKVIHLTTGQGIVIKQ